MVGYHFIIKRDGTVETGRPLDAVGSHVEGKNSISVGICMIGGVKEDGKTAEDNFTAQQYAALAEKLREMRRLYPNARICGHRDLSKDRNGDGKITPNEWSKMCPSFDVARFLTANSIR